MKSYFSGPAFSRSRPDDHAAFSHGWAAAPQGGRERILLRACIPDRDCQFAAPHAEAARRSKGCSGEALGELKALGQRSTGGDGFADGFPGGGLAGLIKAKLERPLLAKADWVAFGTAIRT